MNLHSFATPDTPPLLPPRYEFNTIVNGQPMSGTMTVEGQPVVDLWAGHRDAARTLRDAVTVEGNEVETASLRDTITSEVLSTQTLLEILRGNTAYIWRERFLSELVKPDQWRSGALKGRNLRPVRG